MYWVPELVVNPCDSGLRMKVRCIIGDQLFGTTIQGDDPIMIDLNCGCLVCATGIHQHLSRGHLPPEKKSVPAPKVAPARNSYEQQKRDEEARFQASVQKGGSPKNYARGDVNIVPKSSWGVIASLARGRVSGSDVIKGLKRRGYELNCDIMDNYLGGYDIQSCGRTITVESFINLISAARKVGT